MTVNKKIYFIYSIATTMALMNYLSWTKSSDIQVEVSKNANRAPASIDEPTKTYKTFQSNWVESSCDTDQSLETKNGHIRLKIKKCGQLPVIKNTVNHFQATLWEEKDYWYTDYIPLEENRNAIEMVFSEKMEPKRLQITRLPSNYDAK